ncbi:MAG: flippase [Pseudomonas sp.]|nr:flippase [Pseudomonas sp.]MDZ4191249.1 flippase [Pseudomonas sp.]
MNIIPSFIRRKIEHRPDLRRVVSNVGWLFFDKILRMGVGLFVGVWVARYLGPEQFGLFSFAIALVSLFGAFVVLGLPSIVVRDIVRNPSGKEVTLGTAAFLQLIGGVLSYAVLLACVFWLRTDDSLAILIVAIVGGVILFKTADIAIYWFESQVQSKYTVWVQSCVFIFFAISKIVLILMNASVIGFAWVALGEAVVVSVFMLVFMGRRGVPLKSLKVRLARAKELLNDSWPLLLSSVAVAIYMKVDQIMLASMKGDEVAGIYSAALRISEIWYFVPMVICASIFPAMLEARSYDKKIYYQRLQYLFDVMVWLSIMAAVFTTFFSDWIVIFLFGTEYADAGLVLAIHIWGAIFVFLGVASGQWFITENLQFLSFQRALLGLLINVLGNIILIPSYGAIGAAISTILSQAVAAWISDALQPRTRRIFIMKSKSFSPFSIIDIVRNNPLCRRI